MVIKNTWGITVFLFSTILISCSRGNPATEQGIDLDSEENQPITSPTSQTSEPPDKKTKTVPEVNFEPSNSNQTPPDDILLEISYFPGGGGAICGYTETPILYENHFEAELLTLDYITICGWSPNEVITLSTENPDGSKTNQEIVADKMDGDVYYTRLNLKFGLEDTPGLYKYIFTGQSYEFEATANYRIPEKASLLRVSNSQLLMYGFNSGEAVSLYYYYQEKFVGWKKYEVNKNGQLLINVPADTENLAIFSKNQYFVAIGETSGEAPLIFETVLGPREIVNQDSIIWDCGKLRTRLATYLGGRVAYTDGANMRIRKAPGLDSEIIDSIPEGSTFTVIDGPACINDITWWQVIGSFEQGWMAEHNNKIYWLEPMP